MTTLLLLIIYTSLPPLISGLASGEGGWTLCGGIGLFLFQAGAEYLLFRTKKRSFLITGMILFFLILTGAALTGGALLHWSWYRLIGNIYLGPLLTVIYVFIYKLSRPYDFERLSRGLNRIIILLLSYSLLLLLIRLHHILFTPRSHSPGDIFFGFYEAANYLPALYFLRILRDSPLARLIINEDRVWFRNEEITPLFSEGEILILRKACQDKHRILCRDMVPTLNKGKKGKSYDCSYPDCKASLCPAYALVYRRIISLDKKLDSLSLGFLVPPENKREIREKGWRFVPGKDVSVGSKITLPLNIPSPAEFTRQKKDLAFPLLIFLGLAGALLLSAPLMGIPDMITATAGAVLFLLPFVHPQKHFVKRLTASAVFLLLLPLILIPPLGEKEALFLSLKGVCVLAILFLMRYPFIQEFYNLDNIKQKAPHILFWLIWFYMIILSLFGEPVFPGGDNVFGSPDTLLPYLVNRIILFTLFSLSVGFFSREKKPLNLRGERIVFNGKPLPPGLSDSNRIILGKLISREGKPLRCEEILEAVSPEEAELCTEDCKSSACPRYQKIYKRIQAIRKYLQIAGIGTVISPERKADSHREGWYLTLYEDVYYSGQRP